MLRAAKTRYESGSQYLKSFRLRHDDLSVAVVVGAVVGLLVKPAFVRQVVDAIQVRIDRLQ